MDIEVIFVLQVVGTELSEAVFTPCQQTVGGKSPQVGGRGHILSFVPCHDIGNANLVETGEEGEGGKNEGSDDPFPLFEGLQHRGL